MERLRLYFLAATLVLFLIPSCSNDDDSPVLPGDDETAIKTIDSNSGGSVTSSSGAGIDVIAGSVPLRTDNTAASVTFSVESNVTPPQPLPAGAVGHGNVAQMGPVSFTFRWPVRVRLPYMASDVMDGIQMMYFEASESKWFILPASIADGTNDFLGADVLQLGYFTLADVSGIFKGSAENQGQGGFEYSGTSNFHYTLTVRSVTFKYPNQAPWYNLVGRAVASSGSDPTGTWPLTPLHARLPQGNYEIWVTRTKAGTFSTPPEVETYTIPATGTIDRALTVWGMGNENGWTTLQSPGGGVWKEGRPSEWPEPTTPMGTGEFQATLTWLNKSTHYADMDLHVWGPNMHVYFGDKLSDDGSVQLDRDWQSTDGDAVENIFSVNSMPKGSYRIMVRNYGGDNMTCAVRVIRFGSVKTYNATLSSKDSTNITSFSIN